MFWKRKKGGNREEEEKKKEKGGEKEAGSKKAEDKKHDKKSAVKKPDGKEKKPSAEVTGLESSGRKRTIRERVFGRLWFRLGYYDERLMKLDDYKQTLFLESYMNSARQLNHSLISILFLMLIIYVVYALQILRTGEVAAAWIILIYLLFYLAYRHRNENEKLLEHLLDSEMTPEYLRKR